MQNERADALVNGDDRHSDSALRIAVDLSTLNFIATSALFQEGEAYAAELDELKKAEAEKRRRVTEGGKPKTAKQGLPLRERKPR